MRDRVQRLIACLCLAACCPCCFPCYICAIRSRKRRRQREEYEAIMEHHRVGPRSPDTVKPLRRGRRRRVSIPPGVRKLVDEKALEEEKGEEYDDGVVEVLDEKVVVIEADAERDRAGETVVSPTAIDAGAEEQTTYTQSQSLLFRKLPPEIRSLIWRECVGNFDIYLGVIPEEKRVGHWKIFEGKGLMRLSMDQEEQDRLMGEHRFIPLLRTCRRIYTEAIPYLYSSNSFLLSTPGTLLALSSTTLLHRFNTISHMSIKFTPQLQHGLSFGLSQPEIRLWHRAIDLLASMKGLRSLEIVLWDRSMYGTPGEWENVDTLLDMLGRVRQCRRYVVVLDQYEGGEAVESLKEKIAETRPPFDLRFGRGDGDGERFFWII